jgi:hypothetical protein
MAVTGCGGGSGTDSAATITPAPVTPPVTTPVTTPVATLPKLVGTAATGAPIAGTVVAIDINGKSSLPATTSAAGAFTVDVAGLTAPFILSITGTSNGKQVFLNSIATAAGQTVNITPLTDLIVSAAAGVPGGNSLTNLCTPVDSVLPKGCLTALTEAAKTANLSNAVQKVKDMIAPLNTADTNPLTGAFEANGQGFDAILDKILVMPADAGSMLATVTLIGTNTQIGQVSLPATAGGTSTTTATPPTTQQVQSANAAGTVLAEIRACTASLSAFYPKTNFTPPTAQQVSPFIDASFYWGSDFLKNDLVGGLTSGTYFFGGGFSLSAAALSQYDMSPLSASEITSFLSIAQAGTGTLPAIVQVLKGRPNGGGAISFDGNGNPVSAWVVGTRNGDTNGNWKFVKGAAFTGCPGGWKFAGPQHADMHMDARITRRTDASGNNATFIRERAFHLEVDAVNLEAGKPATNKAGIAVEVRGPGLRTYTGNTASPVSSSSAKLTLTIPATLATALQIGDGSTYYRTAEALESCQDLALRSAPPAAGTPCIDETRVAPGAVYGWLIKKDVDPNVSGSGTVVAAFPYEVFSVPLSKAFAQANQSSLFATLTSTTPATVSAVKTALSTATGPLLDNLFTFNYTQGAAYGSRMDGCRLSLSDRNGDVLIAEYNATGKETTCTFVSSGLYSGSLDKPSAQVISSITGAYVSVGTSVLGNDASSQRPLQP